MRIYERWDEVHHDRVKKKKSLTGQSKNGRAVKSIGESRGGVGVDSHHCQCQQTKAGRRFQLVESSANRQKRAGGEKVSPLSIPTLPFLSLSLLPLQKRNLTASNRKI